MQFTLFLEMKKFNSQHYFMFIFINLLLQKSVKFLQAELPRRIARRVMDFQSLPYVVAINPNIQHVV